MAVHETAIVHPTAELADGVSVGPYTIIGEGVRIAEGTWIGPHVVIDRWTSIGANCRIYQYASIGTPAQHLKYRGEETYVIIGDNNVIREFVTINRGTLIGDGKTEIGDNNFIMAYAHIAHDCKLGNNVIMANAAQLAGHVIVEDNAVIGGVVAVHQFVRIGRFAFIGGATSVPQDIPPYVTASGMRAKLYGINVLNLKRHGFTDEVINALKKAYRLVFRSHLTLREALQQIREAPIFEYPEVQHFVNFLEESKRGITR
ncbi:MAG: acyl-[acyl-carrier-protein]--UDP-N-acetylglucosamine O-acyltransferase [Deltaproteobacteria bacterium]|nr:MAG: acyl-[acyl-carrier-protein]--UDP-N-acetylglucosamine O-acyltransferase [Deltaproteobacteria bacterium]